MKEAMFYEKLSNNRVKCVLCPRNCVITDSNRGTCGVRENRKGRLFSLVYSKVCSINPDPIEKKPLFHFAPGSSCLSISTMGCNLFCKFCQNWEISHPEEIQGEDIQPERIVEVAKKNNYPGIAYTYTEPSIFYELAYDTMRIAKKHGLYNVWVSNGYTNPEPAKKISKYLDAINIDLKGDMAFYQKLCAVPNEEPMHKALKVYKKAGVFIEITTLVIPGYNDSEKTIKGIMDWVKHNLGVETPVHFSRFYPDYKMLDVEPTPVSTLEMCVKVAKEKGMHWVYLGNVYGHKQESTLCWKCGKPIIKRMGYEIQSFKDKCEKCNVKVPIAGKEWMK